MALSKRVRVDLEKLVELQGIAASGIRLAREVSGPLAFGQCGQPLERPCPLLVACLHHQLTALAEMNPPAIGEIVRK